MHICERYMKTEMTLALTSAWYIEWSFPFRIARNPSRKSQELVDIFFSVSQLTSVCSDPKSVPPCPIEQNLIITDWRQRNRRELIPFRKVHLNQSAPVYLRWLLKFRELSEQVKPTLNFNRNIFIILTHTKKNPRIDYTVVWWIMPMEVSPI